MSKEIIIGIHELEEAIKTLRKLPVNEYARQRVVTCIDLLSAGVDHMKTELELECDSK